MTDQETDPLFCEIISELEPFEVKAFMAHLVDAAIVIKGEIVADRFKPNSHYKVVTRQRDWERRQKEKQRLEKEKADQSL